jgi:hypothetical protein
MSAIDIAVMTALKTDATLTTLAPGGVYRDIAPEAVVNAALQSSGQVFGVVTLQSAPQHYSFSATRAFEECRYLVKFVSPSTSPIGAQAAMDRAEIVLASVTASGFAISCSRREERISYVEADGPVYWQHRGVSWLIMASPTS